MLVHHSYSGPSSNPVHYHNTQHRHSYSSTTSNNATTSQMVAIDSKIEQAMDLVKTHLMFAVREEVDVLKARIGDLEQHVIHLEAENSILRDYIPEDILKKLNIHQK